MAKIKQFICIVMESIKACVQNGISDGCSFQICSARRVRNMEKSTTQLNSTSNVLDNKGQCFTKGDLLRLRA